MDAFPPWHAALAALRLPFLPPEFAFGLAVFCCMPTTLSSGVSLTQVRPAFRSAGLSALSSRTAMMPSYCGINQVPLQ